MTESGTNHEARRQAFCPPLPPASAPAETASSGGLATDIVLRAHDQILQKGKLGAVAGGLGGIPVGVLIGVIGIIARGKTGPWPDVIIHAAFGIILLALGCALLGAVFGAMAGGCYGALHGAIIAVKKHARPLDHAVRPWPAEQRSALPTILPKPTNPTDGVPADQSWTGSNLVYSDEILESL